MTFIRGTGVTVADKTDGVGVEVNPKNEKEIKLIKINRTLILLFMGIHSLWLTYFNLVYHDVKKDQQG